MTATNSLDLKSDPRSIIGMRVFAAPRPGAYQIQAAITAIHARAPNASATDWQAIDRLYAALERLQPSPVVPLNRAVAVSRVEGPAATKPSR